MSYTRQFLSESVDNFTAFQFLKKLSTPFNKWPAYRLGIIDEHGNIIRSKHSLSREEKQQFSSFDILVLNLRKIIDKTPGGRSKISNYIASLYLLRESAQADWYTNEDIAYEGFQDFYEEVILDPKNLARVNQLMESHLPIQDRSVILDEDELEEDAPANSVAAGGVAGLTEPVVRKTYTVKKKKTFKEHSEENK